MGLEHINKNSISEPAVKNQSLGVRTLLSYAERCWSSVISTMLRPYNILSSVYFCNLWGKGEDNKTQVMRLLRLKKSPDLKMEHTFGFSFFVCSLPDAGPADTLPSQRAGGSPGGVSHVSAGRAAARRLGSRRDATRPTSAP